jgi:peptide/nickel transport system substrate-binding protein
MPATTESPGFRVRTCGAPFRLPSIARRWSNQVYLGAGVPVFGVVSPGNRQWYAPPSSDGFDPARARLLLSGLGLVDRNGDGVLEDRSGAAARFSVISLQSDSIRMKTVAVMQSQLRRLGILVDSVGLDAGAIVQRWASGEYDAIYFGVEATSYDPDNNLDFWLSSGSFHVWNPGQSSPRPTGSESRYPDA